MMKTILQKRILYLFLVFFSMISHQIIGQTTINFDTAGNWTAGSASITSYAVNHTYTDGVFSATGGQALRNGTTAQDGFPGALGTYSWRLRDNASVEWTVTIASGGVSTFSMDIRRWDFNPSPNLSLDYSLDGGSNWTNVSTIDNNSLDNSSAWKNFGGTINSGVNDIKIRLKAQGTTERIMVDNFVWSGFTSSLPSISTSVASFPSFGDVNTGNNSASQSFTVTGVNLTDVVAVAASSDFEVSTDDVSFSSGLNLAQTGGTLDGEPVTLYVRFSPTVAGLNNGTITLTSTDADDKTVTVFGTGVEPTPELFVSSNTLPDFGDIIVGEESTSQSFTVSGSLLTANTLIVAPGDFVLSTDDVTFSSFLNLGQTGGNING